MGRRQLASLGQVLFSSPGLSFTPTLCSCLRGAGWVLRVATVLIPLFFTDPSRWDRYYGSRLRDPRTWDRRYWYDSEHDPYRKDHYAYSDRLVK